MLQQTQVDRVIPKFLAWMKRFPTPRALSTAPVSDVLTLWSGLGYNRRALNLQRAARMLVERFQGGFPRSEEELRSLPGVGPYTAAAVRAFAFNLPGAAVDTNVIRVLGRYFSGPRPIPAKRTAALALAVVPANDARRTYSALMDFGALVCTAAAPRCDSCPLRGSCPSAHNVRATKRGRAEAGDPHGLPLPRRMYRGRVLKALVQQGPQTITALGPLVLSGYGSADEAWLWELVEVLVKEGFVQRRGHRISLAAEARETHR